MKIIRSKIFGGFPEIVFAFSTKDGLHREEPYFFNLSYNVGENEKIVAENRKYFFDYIGIDESRTAFQKQIHSDVVKIVTGPGLHGESDALITNKPNLGLAISSADCVAVFVYDPVKKVIAAVHAGWKGTAKRILDRTLQVLKNDFGSEPANLYCYISPSITQKNYQVGKEVTKLFNKKYVSRGFFKRYLDIRKANFDMLIEFGIPAIQIETSRFCSFEEHELLHSYRRDGKFSGRSLGIIYLRGINE
jgi:YfiH family protein